MLTYRIDASQYHQWLPPLDPKASFVELSYSSEGGNTIREVRGFYQSCDVALACEACACRIEAKAEALRASERDIARSRDIPP